MNSNLTGRSVLLLILLISSHFGIAQRLTKTVTVYFESDKSVLTPASQKMLSQFLQTADTLNNAEMTVTGHTDSEGSDDYNDVLSERRVQAVIGFLDQHKKNALPALVSSLPNGEKAPAATNDTPKGMSMNRRVEITYSYPDPAFVAAEKISVLPKETIQDLYKQLQPAGTVYCIDNRRDTLLVCEKGTVIHIPANAFKGKLKTPCTELTIVEALDYSDMILQNLSTDSPKGLLVTGGMVDISGQDATGNPLQLKTDKVLTLYFPTDSVTSEMDTYYGKHDPATAQEAMRWYPADKHAPVAGSGLPLSFWLDCWTIPASCERCRFFFCRFGRIGQAFKGMADRTVHLENKAFRRCQKQIRRTGFRTQTAACAQQYQWLADQKIVPDTVLFRALYSNYMEANGIVSIADARAAMQQYQDSINAVYKERYAIERRRNDSIAAIRAKINQLSYNVISSTRLNAINCDYFPANTQLINVPTKIAYATDTDLKLVFKSIRAIMPAYPDGKGNFQFVNIPKNKHVWLIALKITDEQPYLFMEEFKIGKDLPEIAFQPVSVEELKIALKRLD